LRFEANQGQADSTVRYLSRGPGFALYLTDAAATLVLAPPRNHAPQSPFGPHHELLNDPITATTPLTAAVVRLRFDGASTAPAIAGEERLPGVSNYLGGGATARRTDIPTYGRVVYHDLYPGIDLAYYGHAGALEYDYTVAPGGDPAAIALGVDGARDIQVDGQGALLLRTAAGVLAQQPPAAYQEVAGARSPVAVR